MLIVVLCLSLWSLARALLLWWILDIPIVMTSIISLLVLLGSFIYIGYILWFGGISFLLLILIIAVTWFVFNDVHDVYAIVFRPLLLLVVIVVGVDSVCVEVADVLGLTVQLIVVAKVSIIINDFNLFL